MCTFSNPKLSIAIIWTVDDVLQSRSDLTSVEAREVLAAVEDGHNPDIGINWDYISDVADMLFPRRSNGDLIAVGYVKEGQEFREALYGEATDMWAVCRLVEYIDDIGEFGFEHVQTGFTTEEQARAFIELTKEKIK